MNRPHTQALAQAQSLPIRPLPLLRPLAWLARGWVDLASCPWPGLVHGLAVFAFGALLLVLAGRHFWLLAGAFSGFLLVAPVLATGLYRVSRELEHGLQPSLRTALRAWMPRDKRVMQRLVLFGSLLALAGTGWVLTSAALITRFAPGVVREPLDFVRAVVLAPQGWLFETWLALGALLAAPVFASSVIAIPLLLDRHASVASAVYASWRVVLMHPAPMALWALVIVLLTLLAMAPLLLGLVVVVPWLAHASWHAYRDLIGHGSRHRLG